MKTNNNKMKHKLIKLVIIYIMLTVLSYALLDCLNKTQVYAATQIRETYSDSRIVNYPQYKTLIENLKKEHPNWKFTIFYTDLDWNQVIKNESTAYHGRNVVPASWTSSWKCSTCGETAHGGSGWRCASEAAVAYYMDPRNWINATNIFQFENLAYNEDSQNLEGVQKIISSIKYMQGDKITYTKTDGSKATLEKTYAQVIMEAAKEAKISPYHLASRIRQEQGTGATPGSTATGTYKGYIGYYNFLNIKASGSYDAQVIANGLEYAKSTNGKEAWTNPEISIKAGAKILAKNYINDGQDTLYLQKFDVDGSDGTLYYFQYMQNVAACVNESSSIRKAYEQLGMIDSSIEFIIPVYENMPEEISPAPQEANIVTQNIKVKGNNVAVRQSPSISASQIATVNTGDTLLRIEIATKKQDDYYWDKIVLPSGTKGFMARNYIVEIPDITNNSDTVIANTSVNLRNGPGVNGTTIVTTLTEGQAMQRIETNKYNIDGYIWDRVKLADGRQGYIAQNYIKINGEISTGTTVELVKVICESGLKVREQAGTDQKVLTYVNKNDILTRTKAGASNANGYTWDKIVTASGIEGYIARCNSKEQYIEVISQEKPTNTPEKINNNFKIENNKLVCEPETTMEDIKQKYKEITAEKEDGTKIENGKIGTGDTITIDKEKYRVIKIGDVNGDGKINSGDSLILSKQVLKTMEITDEYKKEAADVNMDGKINSGDTLILRKQILGTYKISL